MRRRSERKKSADVSPVASSRRSSRRTRRSPDNDKNEDSEQQFDDTQSKMDSSPNRASSEERVETTRRGRLARPTRTSAKRRLRSISGTEKKIDAIAEEENGLSASCEEKDEHLAENKIPEVDEKAEKMEEVAQTEVAVVVAAEVIAEAVSEKPAAIEEEDPEAKAAEIACEPKSKSNEKQQISEVIMAGTEVQEEEEEDEQVAETVEDAQSEQVEEDKTPEKEPKAEESNTESPLTSSDQNVDEESIQTPTEAVQETKTDTIELTGGTESSADKILESPNQEQTNKTAKMAVVETETLQEASNVEETAQKSSEKEAPVDKVEQLIQTNNNNNNSNNNNNKSNILNVDQTRTRKRKWLTKKGTESKAPILAISTDSLKNLIADVHPVPLSDVQLESSSEVEELPSPRGEVIEKGSTSPSDNEQRRRSSLDTTAKEKEKSVSANATATTAVSAALASVPKTLPVHSSPSPPRNQTSSVLYISNLVRPFTVLQLKGLLARTGKIMENGFWIDRIKSKCYVQYETEDEAIETRHALHGVRWPVSNPKCLNVDFAKQVDIERAIQSTSDDVPKYGHDTKDNYIPGSGWNREQLDTEDKKVKKKYFTL